MVDGSRLVGVGRPTPAPIGFHVMVRLDDDRPIATTVTELRVVARVVLAQGECRGLLAFGAADNHIHALLATDRITAGHFAQYVEIALGRRLGLATRFQRSHVKALQDQGHAYRAFHYVQRQDSRHGLGLDLAREGTSLPDLLGGRLIESSILARVRRHLPRVRREELVGHFPAGAFDSDKPIAIEVLADAAAAVFAIPDLAGRGVEAARARRAAAHVAGANVTTKALSECLGIGARAVQLLRALPPEPSVVRAVRLQALLRTPVRADAA